jgi:hypothetical protein
VLRTEEVKAKAEHDRSIRYEEFWGNTKWDCRSLFLGETRTFALLPLTVCAGPSPILQLVVNRHQIIILQSCSNEKPVVSGFMEEKKIVRDLNESIDSWNFVQQGHFLHFSTLESH